MNSGLATVSHVTAGRMKLVLPENRDGAVAIPKLTEMLKSCELIHEIDYRHRTGSLIIRHTGSTADLITWFEENLIPILNPLGAKPKPLSEVLQSALGQLTTSLDKRISEISGGELDSAGAASLILALFGLNQIMNGRTFPAGLTVLLMAQSVLNGGRNSTLEESSS